MENNEPDIKVLAAKIDSMNVTLNKLTESFQKLAVFIEKTNENDRKITALFNKTDKIYLEGTKNCPVQQAKIHNLEKKIDSVITWLITLGIAFISTMIGVFVFFLEKHIV